MEFVYGDGNYHLRVEQPNIDLDHLYPELPYVVLRLKISFLVESRFMTCLADGSTTGLDYFLSNPVKERSRTFVLRDFFENSRVTCISLSEILSTLEVDGECFNQIIETIISIGRYMCNCIANKGRKVLCLNVSITEKQDVNAQNMSMALRESAAEFERANNGMVPVTQSGLDSLIKRVKIKGEKNSSVQDCSICLEEFETRYAISMPCSHLFHGGCICRWLKRSHYCPLCRYQLPT